jgi:MoaA/NifB/PqqE/SkfB family radical SAM enzyme
MNVVVSKHNDGELLSLFEIAHRYNFDFFCIMPLKQGDIFEIYNNDLVTKQIWKYKKEISSTI